MTEAKAEKRKCQATHVQPSREITVNGVQHAGVVTHKCTQDDHSSDESCVCACGARFIKNYK